MSKVSIIIPTYNHAHYLAEAIESILAQTFTDWEAIIVDDGSTDSTFEVVSRFTDARIHYIHQENAGLAAARNRGIRAAGQEYLAFLDADDEWEPNFLAQCVDRLEKDDKAAAVYTRFHHIDRKGATLPRPGGQVIKPEELRRRLIEGGFFPPCAVVARTAIVQEAGMFDTELEGQGAEDWDLWLRITEEHRMEGIAQPLARYRVYSQSMSTDVKEMHTNRVAVLAKHFGPPDDNPTTWSEEKRRAYGFAYRFSALGYIQQGQSEKGWDLMNQAILIWPRLLERVDTFYELACTDQSKGYRGQADLLDVDNSGRKMLKWLDSFGEGSDVKIQSKLPSAYSNAYLALTMLSDQSGNWVAARRYILRAIKANPYSLQSYSVIRRLLKLCFGQRVIASVRRLIGDNKQEKNNSFSYPRQG
jgi:tetratricopeptide (TPR) repeat protein